MYAFLIIILLFNLVSCQYICFYGLQKQVEAERQRRAQVGVVDTTASTSAPTSSSPSGDTRYSSDLLLVASASAGNASDGGQPQPNVTPKKAPAARRLSVLELRSLDDDAAAADGASSEGEGEGAGVGGKKTGKELWKIFAKKGLDPIEREKLDLAEKLSVR